MDVAHSGLIGACVTMAGVAHSIDRFAGALSRFLHLRGARVNTAGDLAPYLGASPAVLFPPVGLPNEIVRRRVRQLRARGRILDALEWPSAHQPLCPRYLERHLGPYAVNRKVSARWLYPRSGPRSAALVYVHGWLEPGPWVEEAIFLPRLYEALGVDVLHLQLPFHGSRNPAAALFHGELFWTADLVRSFEAVRQSCTDARTLVAWLRAQGYTEIGVTGISMGGSIAMVLACLDLPPDYIVPIIGHLQLGDAIEEAPIFWSMKRNLERFGIGRARRRQIFEQFGLAKLTPSLPPQRQLWIMARDDAFITAPVVERQWRAWGEPPIEWIAGGHMTVALSLGRVVERMRQFHASLR
ncbi:MAG TPA: alpha/beta hydrolase family protein [Polyangiaceae bacterium]|nr:alpha/beta hydrolase family protein [Polyangiaceae bacterium]